MRGRIGRLSGQVRVRRAIAACCAGTISVLSVLGAVGVWPVGAPAGAVGTAADQPRHGVLEPLFALIEDLVAASRPPETPEPANATAVPERSGTGRRVVFDISAQRVWLARADGTVRRTYPVSGSRYDNLRPGHYTVYSISRHATAFDYSSTMQYFVRFTRGSNAAIGFHDIPVDSQGRRVQSPRQLGQPLSSGCIRQRRPDARALWDFAPIGTRVVVVA
jgi:lipoprotein-anchoring transpeptidase ErfK/SrfK